MSLLKIDFYLRSFAECAALAVSPGGTVLDAGAGDSPYRDLFDHCNYEAADVCKRSEHGYQYVNYVCDLSAIPVEDERYDGILCTQVLEHVPDPSLVIKEFSRILKKGGTAWISAPFCYEEHEIPYDYFRFTQYGWREMLSKSGFEIIDMGWVQGYCGAVAYQMNLARHYLPKKSSGYGGGLGGAMSALVVNCIRPLLGALALLLAWRDRCYRYTERRHPLDYFVVAKKV